MISFFLLILARSNYDHYARDLICSIREEFLKKIVMYLKRGKINLYKIKNIYIYIIDLVKDFCIFLNWALSIRLVRRQWDIFNVMLF